MRLPPELDGDEWAKVGCGQDTSWGITRNGQLLTWGDNRCAQLGLGPPDLAGQVVQQPRLVSFAPNDTVKLVSMGDSHTMVVSKSGVLSGFGCDTEGQIGLGTSLDKLASVRLDQWNGLAQAGLSVDVAASSGDIAAKAVKSVAASRYFSLALTDDGQVWASGGGYKGELTQHSRLEVFCPLNHLPPSFVADQLGCGLGFGMASSAADGAVYIWGGYGPHAAKPEPTPRCVLPSCGNKKVTLATGRHHGAISDGEHVWTVGYGGDGCLGLGSTADAHQAHMVDLSSLRSAGGEAGIADIVCGHYNTAVITDDGRLFACGRNDSGLLGDSKPKRVTSLVEIRLGGYRCRAVAIGAKHALALVEKA